MEGINDIWSKTPHRQLYISRRALTEIFRTLLKSIPYLTWKESPAERFKSYL